MAVPLTEIPWHLLTANFEFATSHPDFGDITDFYPCKRPDQGQDLNKFVEQLAESLVTSATQDRKKYAESYEAAEHNDIVIPKSDAVKIAVPLRRWYLVCSPQNTPRRLQGRGLWQQEYGLGWCDARFKSAGAALPSHRSSAADDDGTCTHMGDECECLPRFEERRMSTFLHAYKPNTCYEFDRVNGDAFFGMELLKTLILHGSMDTVLRICAHPDVDFLSWWGVMTCYCMGPDVALSLLCQQALRAFICLNFIRRGFPERCGRGAGKGGSDTTANSNEDGRLDTPPDYLRTRTYQKLVYDLTISDMTTEVPQFGHMDFFGIRHRQCLTYPRKRDEWEVKDDNIFPLGRVSYKEFLSLDFDTEPAYMPSGAEVETARLVLAANGLPTELVDIILGFAEFDETRVLRVPHDPFHELNRDQLDEHLSWCWQTLLRCDMMARALGDEIPWDMLIGECLLRTFPLPISQRLKRLPDGRIQQTVQCFTQTKELESDGLRFEVGYKTVFL